LNQVYYQNESNTEEIEALEKKQQNIKLKLQEVTKERNLLQEMCSEKDAKLRELISKFEIEKESEEGAKEIQRNLTKVNHKSTQKSMPSQPPVVVNSLQE
jgi:predicted nuclease with TOPRIM domain